MAMDSPIAPYVVGSLPTVNYHPSLWDNITFISNESNEPILCEWRERAENLKEKILKMLTEEDQGDLPNNWINEKLRLIDSIQRLGVAYHFEQEIENILARIFTCFRAQIDSLVGNDDDLNVVALRFRLLREHGHNLSCDVFSKFVDNKGEFLETLCNDVDGLLSLYEASHFRVKGEVILDKALNFTTRSLQSLLPSLSPPLAKQVGDALYRPVRKRLLRSEARNYMSIYEEDQQHSGVLLHFAKLDFNILQKLHQEELDTIVKWWKDQDCANKFPFARNRIVEDYFWILGMHFEPEFAMGRRFLTKIIAMASVIDDIYDTNCWTKEELNLFTNAVDRWDDASAIVDLPVHMKACHKILLDVFRETEQEMVNQGRSPYGVDCAKEEMKRLIKAYMEERKWVEKQGGLPTIEEYMKVALVSSGYAMLSVASLVCMSEVAATEEAFDWMVSEPEIIKAASVICRLMDDVVSQFEQLREHPPSAVECYAAQYDVSKETACDALRKEVEDAWKDINKAFLKPTPVGKSVLMRILNLARVMDALYKESDGYTHVTPAIKESITSLLLTEVQV